LTGTFVLLLVKTHPTLIGKDLLWVFTLQVPVN
jgi:hypothetical protein